VASNPPVAAPRANGLNLLRLLLAGAVLVAHALLVAGVPAPPHVDLGYWAVAGFFCISGYLVTRSASRLPTTTYLRHRLARLMPGYWMCLLVTGVVIAPAAVSQPDLIGDGLVYASANAGLVITQWSIDGTPAVGNYPGVWNASLWTLLHEFVCYLVVGGLVLLRPFRRAKWAGWALAWLVAVTLHVALLRFAPDAPFLLRGFARLLPLFLAGALVQAVCPLSRLRLSTGVTALAVGCVAVLLVPAWGMQLSAPLLAYGLLAVGLRLPSPRFVAREDISYGTYLYAFPVTQLLAHFWLPEGAVSVVAWLAAIAVLTTSLALASWFLVEKKALSWARRPSAPSTHPPPAGLGAQPLARLDERPSGAPTVRSDAGSR
jgi:peptidoglycan/LPS O-acetylase OafA/YrhL